MKINLREIIQSKALKYSIIILGSILVLLSAFKAGELVGFRKAEFSYKWGEGYYRSVMGQRKGQMGNNFGENDFLMGHGVAGPIIKISSSTITVQDRDGAEKMIQVSNETVIKKFRETISINNLLVGESVAVIGSPNNTGQIGAKLIRVLPPPENQRVDVDQNISQ
ncbi:MAG: DUF5666 domain-containing protein [Candidatus Jorgensenbacteria bacterium]|nr:DUF5666 domain-containing protein [Candidatus Jorgensenbacteria bacterium]